MVSADTWGGLKYAWPDGGLPEDPVQHQWYIYWMQNMPGRDNNIRHGTGVMNNWWAFTGDWDGSVRQVSRRWGLYRLP